jgi:thioredoxin 1
MDKYLLLDFWAPWCSPCKLMNPIIDEIEKGYDLKVQRINVDEDSAMVQQYNITSVPTYILLKEGGEIVNFVVGAKAKAGFIKQLGLDDLNQL